MKNFSLLCVRSFRGGVQAGATAAVFALVVASLFALALGAQAELLRAAAPAILWLTVLLAALLSLEPVWHRDAASGHFDLLLLSGVSPYLAAGAVMAAHWLSAGLPLVLAALPLGLMLQLPPEILPLLCFSLLLGTVYLVLVGGVGAWLTFGARQPAVLMVVIVLPLMLPMLLLGLMAVETRLAGVEDLAANPYLLWQAALALVALPVFPLVAGLLLRQQFFR